MLPVGLPLKLSISCRLLLLLLPSVLFDTISAEAVPTPTQTPFTTSSQLRLFACWASLLRLDASSLDQTFASANNVAVVPFFSAPLFDRPPPLTGAATLVAASAAAAAREDNDTARAASSAATCHPIAGAGDRGFGGAARSAAAAAAVSGLPTALTFVPPGAVSSLEESAAGRASTSIGSESFGFVVAGAAAVRASSPTLASDLPWSLPGGIGVVVVVVTGVVGVCAAGASAAGFVFLMGGGEVLLMLWSASRAASVLPAFVTVAALPPPPPPARCRGFLPALGFLAERSPVGFHRFAGGRLPLPPLDTIWEAEEQEEVKGEDREVGEERGEERGEEHVAAGSRNSSLATAALEGSFRRTSFLAGGGGLAAAARTASRCRCACFFFFVGKGGGRLGARDFQQQKGVERKIIGLNDESKGDIKIVKSGRQRGWNTYH